MTDMTHDSQLSEYAARLNFAGSARPLLRAFRSVGIVIERSLETGVISPDPTILADWILRWNRWFRGTAGIVDGDQLHLEYRRDVSVITDIDFEGLMGLKTIASACRSVDIGFGVSMLFSETLKHRRELSGILKDGWPQMLNIVYDLPPKHSEDLISFIEELFANDIAIRLAGNPTVFLEAGILSSPVVNACNVTIAPSSHPASCQASSFRQTPCQPILKIVVDSTGCIYPCLGMLGLSAGRLGHIEEAMEDTVLGGGRPALIDLPTLAKEGPAIPENSRPDRSRGLLPVICEHHRGVLLANND